MVEKLMEQSEERELGHFHYYLLIGESSNF